MTQQEIIMLAANGAPPDEPLDCADRALYYAARDLYANYRAGRISAETGAKLKAEALGQHRIDAAKLRDTARITAHHAELWRRIENAAIKYREERTLENADSFVEAVYGVPLKERSERE